MNLLLVWLLTIYGNYGASSSRSMFGMYHVQQQNTTQEVQNVSGLLNPRMTWQSEREMHTEYNYLMRNRETSVPKPPNNNGLRPIMSSEIYPGNVYRRQTSYPDYGSFQNSANNNLEENVSMYPGKPPQYVWRSSAPYNYQNMAVSMQQKESWQYLGSRYPSNMGELSLQSTRPTLEERPFNTQNSQVGRIRVRDMNSLNNLTTGSQQISAGLQKHSIQVNRCAQGQDTLGQGLNPVNYPSSLVERNNCRFPAAAPTQSMGQNNYTYAQREQVLQSNQYQVYNRSSEVSYASTSDLMFRDYRGFFNQNNQVPQKGRTTANSSSFTSTANKDNNLSLRELLKSGNNSGQSQYRSSFNYSESSKATKAASVNQRVSSTEIETVTPQVAENFTSCGDSPMRVTAVISLPQWCSKFAINKPSVPTSKNCSLTSDIQENENERIVKHKPPGLIPEDMAKVLLNIKKEPEEPEEPDEPEEPEEPEELGEPYEPGEAEETERPGEPEETERAGQPKETETPGEPKEPSERKELAEPEQQNRATEIVIQFVKSEIFQSQDEHEQQIISDENYLLSDNLDIGNENIEKLNIVDESQGEESTIEREKSNVQSEDSSDAQEVALESTGSNYKSQINRDKLDMLIEFLRGSDKTSDDVGAGAGKQNYSTKPKKQENKRRKMSSEKGEISAKDISKDKTIMEMTGRSVQDLGTAKADDSEKKTKTKKFEQSAVLKEQSRGVGNADKIKYRDIQQKSEKRKPELGGSKTAETEKRIPTEKSKSSEASKWKPDTDTNSEKSPEAENSMEGVSDDQENSKFDGAEDSPQPGPSTENRPQEEIKFPKKFNLEYKLCEKCLMIRSTSELWMNIGTRQLHCTYCLKGTNRPLELQGRKLQTVEGRESRGSTESIYTRRNISDSLWGKEKMQKESSDGTNYPATSSSRKEEIRREKRKSLDENAFREREKKQKLDRDSNQKPEELASRTKGGSEYLRTDESIRMNLPEKKKERARKSSTDKRIKSKRDSPDIRIRVASAEDIWPSKMEIMKKINCTDKHKKSLDILESIQELEKAEESRMRGNLARRQEEEREEREWRELLSEKQDAKKQGVKRRVSWEVEKGEKTQSTKLSLHLIKKTFALSPPGDSAPCTSAHGVSSPVASSFDFPPDGPSAKDVDSVGTNVNKRKRKSKET